MLAICSVIFEAYIPYTLKLSGATNDAGFFFPAGDFRYVLSNPPKSPILELRFYYYGY